VATRLGLDDVEREYLKDALFGPRGARSSDEVHELARS